MSDSEVDVTRVLHKLQNKLSDALLTIAVLETRIDDLQKENAELRIYKDDVPETGQSVQ